MGSEDRKKKLIKPVFPMEDHMEGSGGRHPGQNDILTESRLVPMDVIETGDRLTVDIDLPGINPSEITVRIQENILVVEGVKREAPRAVEKVNFILMERSFGPFRKRIKLPFAVDKEAVEAVYKNGTLRVSLPKLSERRKKTHVVKIIHEK